MLDIGCGLGRRPVFFARQGFDVSAFDLSEEGAGYPALDGNTVVKTGGGPEDGVPHFYVSMEEIP